MKSAHDRYAAFQRQRNTTPLRLDSRSTALVIVDMQEYFLNGASPYSRACEGTVPGVLEYFQERGRAVVEPSLRLFAGLFPRPWPTRRLYHGSLRIARWQ